MVTAFILLNVERDRIAAASQEVLGLAGITEVYSVAGPYDLVAVARVRENDALAKLVTEDLIKVKGIIQTSTLIAFRQYSQFDLERAFGLGMWRRWGIVWNRSCSGDRLQWETNTESIGSFRAFTRPGRAGLIGSSNSNSTKTSASYTTSLPTTHRSWETCTTATCSHCRIGSSLTFKASTTPTEGSSGMGAW